MKEITFKKCGGENYALYIEPVDYSFENDKIRLITGPNGSGKTSIFDIIPFTLFGVTSKGLKGDDVVNNTVGKNCHTYVEFSITENDATDNYRADRYVKNSKLGDTVLLFKNDFKKPFKKGQKEVLPTIEDIIVPQKLFVNTQSFGQKVKDFFTDLTDSERKDIFRKVLQLDNYVTYQDETSIRIKKVEVDLSECNYKITLNNNLFIKNDEQIKLSLDEQKNFEVQKSSEIQGLTHQNNILNSELDELKEKRKTYENYNDFDLTKIKEDITNVLNEMKIIETEKSHQIDSLNDMKTSKESEFTAKSNELISQEDLLKSESISQINSQHNAYMLSVKETLSTMDNLQSKNLDTIRANTLKMTENLEKIKNLNNSLKDLRCPTCNKPLTDKDVKDKLTKECNTLAVEIEELESDTSELTEKSEKIVNDKNEILSDIKNTQEQVAEKIKNIKDNHQTKVAEIRERLKNGKEKINNLFEVKRKEIDDTFEEKLSSLNSKWEDLKVDEVELDKKLKEKKDLDKDISLKESDIKTTIALIEEKAKQKFNDSMLKKCIEDRKKLFSSQDELKREKATIEEHLEILNFWKTGFSSTGIPSLLIDESIPFLNETVANYLDMVGGRYVVSFDTLSTTKSGEYRDKINVNVLDTQTKANKQKQLSGGQTRIVDIAILLSLCDLQNNVQDMKTNILLLDEIFDSLDDQNIGYISNLLRTLITGKSINIISHRHIDSIEADEVIRLF